MPEDPLDRQALKKIWTETTAQVFEPRLLPESEIVVIDRILGSPKASPNLSRLVNGFNRRRLSHTISPFRRRSQRRPLLQRLNSSNPGKSLPNISLSTEIDSSTVVAGSPVVGRLSLTVKSSKSGFWGKRLQLGEISVQLVAVEVNLDRKPAFGVLYNVCQNFQGQGMPPSTAVSGAGSAHGFWLAKPHTSTLFPFRISLPPDAPGSYTVAKRASLHYILIGSVKFLRSSGGEKLLLNSQVFTVVQRIAKPLPVQPPFHATLELGSEKEYAQVSAAFVSPYALAGSKAYFRLTVFNHSIQILQLSSITLRRSATGSVCDPGDDQRDTVAVQELPADLDYFEPLFYSHQRREVGLSVPLPLNFFTMRSSVTKTEINCCVVLHFILLKSLTSKEPSTTSRGLKVSVPLRVFHPASLYRPENSEDQKNAAKAPSAPQRHPLLKAKLEVAPAEDAKRQTSSSTRGTAEVVCDAMGVGSQNTVRDSTSLSESSPDNETRTVMQRTRAIPWRDDFRGAVIKVLSIPSPDAKYSQSHTARVLERQNGSSTSLKFNVPKIPSRVDSLLSIKIPSGPV